MSRSTLVARLGRTLQQQPEDAAALVERLVSHSTAGCSSGASTQRAFSTAAAHLQQQRVVLLGRVNGAASRGLLGQLTKLGSGSGRQQQRVSACGVSGSGLQTLAAHHSMGGAQSSRHAACAEQQQQQ
jgi:hypothetical protein